jgi:endonuclease YncB( thermonuclease family)
VDRYRRLLSTLFIDGKDINPAMIEAGLAELYRGPESGHPYKPSTKWQEKPHEPRGGVSHHAMGPEPR